MRLPVAAADGEDVFFLTGTDEHGQKVERAARAAGTEPLAFADQTSQKFRDLFSRLNISNDDFIRTTEPRHISAAQEIWRRVRDRGFLYKAPYEGWYCTVDELFVPETQLVDGKCPTCGNAVERCRGELLLQAVSISGPAPVAVPAARRVHHAGDPAQRDRLVRIGRPARPERKPDIVQVGHSGARRSEARHVRLVRRAHELPDRRRVPGRRGRLRRYWPADVHLMGKEIVRQHAVYWPAFLMAADLELAAPRHRSRLVADERRQDVEVARQRRPGPTTIRRRFGVDAFRYYVLREMTLGQDASFSDETFLTRYNADLANDLGNVVSRVATMIARYARRLVPAP
jgi:methionyl-tRNA synthetase